MTQRKTIYFADDDSEDRFLLKDAIETIEKEINIIEVENGLELLQILQDVIPPNECLIIMDINMPKMNGLETLGELRKKPALQSIPVVVVSTSKDLLMIEHAKKLGAIGCFAKPNNMNGLLDLALQLISIIRQIPPDLP